MPTIELENIGTFEFPEGTSDAEMLSEVDRIKSIHYKSKQEESDFSKGRVASGVASAARGLVEGIGQSISGLGRYAAGLTAAIPETVEPGTNPSAEEYQRNIESRQAESGLMKLGSDIQSGAREAYTTNPEYRGEFLADVVPSALGSTAAAASVGALTGPVGAAVQYGFSQAESQAQEAEAAGKPEQADLAFIAALPLGIASEATLGAAPAFWKIVKKLRNLGVDPKTVEKPLARLALETGGFEALQEGIEQVGQNVIAGQLYDPNRRVMEGVPTAMAAGAIVGGAAGAAGGLVGNMARRQALKRVEAQTAAKGAPATAQALASTATSVKPGKIDESSIVTQIVALNQNISNLKASQAAGIKVADEVNAAINAFADSLPEQSTPAPNADQISKPLTVSPLGDILGNATSLNQHLVQTGTQDVHGNPPQNERRTQAQNEAEELEASNAWLQVFDDISKAKIRDQENELRRASLEAARRFTLVLENLNEARSEIRASTHNVSVAGEGDTKSGIGSSQERQRIGQSSGESSTGEQSGTHENSPQSSGVAVVKALEALLKMRNYNQAASQSRILRSLLSTDEITGEEKRSIISSIKSIVYAIAKSGSVSLDENKQPGTVPQVAAREPGQVQVAPEAQGKEEGAGVQELIPKRPKQSKPNDVWKINTWRYLNEGYESASLSQPEILPVSDIFSEEHGASNPRIVEAYKALSSDIPPLIVEQYGNKWRIVDGSTRFNSAKEAGISHVWVRKVNYSDNQHALVEETNEPSTEKGVSNGKEEVRKEVQQEMRDVTATQEPVASMPPVPPSVVSAEQKLIDLTNEAIESEEQRKAKGLGISPLGSSKSSDVILGPITDISSGSSKAEENWQNSIRKREPLLNRIRATADKLWHSMTREYPGLDTVDFAKELDIIYRTRISKDYNTRRAVDVINGITRDLGPKQYSVFNRILVYEDLLKDVEAGMYDGGKELPTGHEDEATLRGDLAKFQAIAESTPPIKKALAKRREFMDALRDTLVERGMLPETVKEDPRYFHHQVLLYMGEKNLQRKSKTFREWRSGWQKARVGSSLEYNREYVESEAAMIADAFSRLHLQELQAEMQATSDITPELKVLAEAQGEGTTVKSIIPESYTEWQPKKGSIFYPVQTVSEKAMEEYLEGIKDLLPEDFKKAVAIGRKLPTWIIPKPLAEVLDNVSRRSATLPERLAFAGQGYWKRWTLYMPLRVAKFMINNQTGDIDFTIAAKPELFKWWKDAFKDLKRLHISKSAATGDVKKAIELGVIGSGWRASELPELSESDAFDAITGRNAGLMDKYFSFVQRMNDLREDTARLGAFRYMMNLQREGKRMWYGASDPKVVDALPTPESKAAHVASDLYINYRRSSEFTDFVRSRIIPFAKWMIGNPARYVQLIRNIPVNEGSSAGRAVGAALAGATLRQTVRLGALYAMFNLWNHLLFPDEEREMGNARRQFHLILGRDKDGNIQTLRASGALSDIMGWFGAEDLPMDIASVLDGKKSPGDIMTDAYQSFISKAVNSALPFHKAAYEAVTQRSLFPNVFQPRSIRDRGEHISKLFSVGTIYKWLAGIPQSPETTDLGSLLFYTHDPGDAAYSSVRQMALEWARKHGKESPGIIPSERSNYLYFYKQALRYGDKELAEKWKERYMSVGGKSEGLAQSVRRSDPLDAVSKNKFEFMRSLSEEEKAMVKRAQDWYRKVYKP